jgi:glutaredoxin 3
VSSILMYTTRQCPSCLRAKRLLDEKNVTYTELYVDENVDLLQEMQLKTGKRTVPQILINENPIGGCDELYALERSGSLDKLLA